MKLKKWIKQIDPLSKIVIWTSDSLEDEEPAFEGYIFDIPWVYMNYEIGRADPDDMDEPIYISMQKHKATEHFEPIIIINLISK